MKVPYVHSNYPRVEGDYYPTIDKRCVYGFLEHFTPQLNCVDVCAPEGSGIVDALTECGYNAQGIADAFEESVFAEWIITNPPYKRDLVDKIINRQIERVMAWEVYGLAVLLRSNFDFAKSRKGMFSSPYYYGQIKLCFRPWWSEEHTKQPIHNYVWHIWTSNTLRFYPTVMYAEGKLASVS